MLPTATRRVPCPTLILLSLSLLTLPLQPVAQVRGNAVAREQWFLKGRQHQGRVAPDLLRKAQQQRRMLSRSSQAKKVMSLASREASSAATAAGWTPLGPAPIVSAASGSNQDYGFITGRATAVAVDQNDPSGNTVYLGGAYGGLWKSTSAAN